MLSLDFDVNFTLLSGPPVHANTPGVFDRTGGELISNGAHFGLCFCILRGRKPIRALIRGVVKSEKGWFSGIVSGGCEGIFRSGGIV